MSNDRQGNPAAAARAGYHGGHRDPNATPAEDAAYVDAKGLRHLHGDRLAHLFAAPPERPPAEDANDQPRQERFRDMVPMALTL